MQESCGFDGALQEVGDCQETCELTGCDLRLLANDQCDRSCSYDVCGWDFGDCGVCNEGCITHIGFEAMLGDGVCDLACDTLSCAFDAGDCGSCASHCYDWMINNSSCDLPCYHQNCQFDGMDCAQYQCAPGCFPEMMGDGRCQDSCHVESCGWDETDCDCAPACLPAFLDNEICDPQCDTPLCEYDSHRCVGLMQGECASGCFLEMLGNGLCEAQCNVEDCSWDLSECGCAPGCDLQDYGTCKLECLVPSCGFDAMAGFPTCPDLQLRLFNQLAQRFLKSTLVRYTYESFCMNEAPSCTMSLWRESFSSCVPECAAFELCGSSTGHCQVCEISHCASCDENKCFQCEDGFVAFFDVCQRQCPISFEESRVLPGYCEVKPDSSSPQQFTTYYVSTRPPEQNLGSRREPFGTVMDAFAALHDKYSLIFLLSGIHKIYTHLQNSYLRSTAYDALFSITPYSSLSIQVKPLLCLHEAHSECVEDLAQIEAANLNAILIHLRGSVVFERVQFLGGSTLVAGCDSLLCSYCPIVQKTEDAVLDDRQQEVEAFAEQSLCSVFETRSFINIEPGASVAFQQVIFQDFRQQFRSLIDFSEGNLLLSNVTFRNLVVSEAVVTQVGASLTSILRIVGADVELLGNGYEYTNSRTFGGFLSSAGLQSLAVESSSFTYNYLGTTTSLFKVGNALTLTFTDCTFTNNLGNILALNSTLGLPPVAFAFAHIVLSNLTFQGNSGASIVEIFMQKDGLNLILANCSFQNNLSTTDGLVAIQLVGRLRMRETVGANRSIMRNSVRTQVVFPPMWVRITEVRFEHNSVDGHGLLHLSNLANVLVQDLNVQTNGDLKDNRNFFEVTLRQFLLNPNVYMTRPVAGLKSSHCLSLLYFSSVSGLTVSNLSVVANTCEQGSSGLISKSTLRQVALSTIRVIDNSAISEGEGAVIHIEAIMAAQAVGLEILRNVNSAFQANGLVSLSAQWEVRDSFFQANSCSRGGALMALGMLTVISSSFVNNTSNGSTASGLFFTPLPGIGLLSVQSTVFQENSSEIGGALTIADINSSPTTFNLQIIDCDFLRNFSPLAGACITIASTVRLSETSIISSSTFTKNHAGTACIVSAFRSGILVIDKCEFSWNVSLVYAVLLAAHEVTTVPSLIILQNSLFEWNDATGGSVIGFIADTLTAGESRNITFRHNLGRGIFTQTALWKDTGSVFFNNTSDTVGAAFVFNAYCVAEITNTTFQQNSAQIGGSVFSASTSSNVAIYSSYFQDNFSPVGGVAYVDQDSQMQVSNCTLRGNVAFAKGATFYVFQGSFQAHTSIENSDFLDNQSPGGVINIVSANVSVKMCRFRNNIKENLSAISAYLSHLQVADSDFEGFSGSMGACIYVPASSVVQVNNCSFSLSHASDRGGAIYASESVLRVLHSQFLSLQSGIGAAIAAVSHSSLTVEYCLFAHSNSTILAGALLHMDESDGVVMHSYFQDFRNGAIAGDGSNITVDACEFIGMSHLDGKSSRGAAMRCEECSLVIFRNSRCSYLAAEIGACLYLAGQGPHLMHEIQNCNFTRSSGQSSGAVHLQNVHTQVLGSRFEGNEVVGSAGAGGALFFSCTSQCNVVVRSCQFVRNLAALKGGAIAWTEIQPVVLDNDFLDNSAQYGAEISSFACNLRAETGLELFDVPSGQPSPHTIAFTLVDHYDQVVNIDNASIADLIPTSSNTTVAGSTRVKAVSGTFNFSAFELRHTPGSNTSIAVQTNGIKNSSPVIVEVHMRLCVAGETVIENICYVCPEGKFNLDPEQVCLECPKGAECLGGSTMVPKRGYWRSSEASAVFWSCPNSDACLGSTAQELLPTGSCAEGYWGNLCHGCTSNFSRESLSDCAHCPDVSTNVGVAIMMVAVLLLVFGITAKASLVSAHSAQSQISVYFKIFLNYVQLIALAAAFNMAWSAPTLRLLESQERAGNVSRQVFSFDCFFDTGHRDSQQRAVFAKVMALACFPAVALCLCGAFWGLVAAAKHSTLYLERHFINSLVLVFFVVHPSIVTLMLNVYSCKEIDRGEFWMNSYLTIRCWSAAHTRLALTVALPSLVLWGFFTPLLALISLMRRRRELEDLVTRIRFGFLYTGYHPVQFYWEFIILYRKVVVAVISVFFSNISIEVQALVVTLVLILSFLMQMRMKPFSTSELNGMEQRGVLVAAVTLYSGLFFLTKDMGSRSQAALFALIVVANSYFCGCWLLVLCRSLKQSCLRIHFIVKLFASMSPRTQVSPGLDLRVYTDGVNFSHSLSFDRSRRVPKVPSNSVLNQ